MAEGLATAKAFVLPLEVMIASLNDFVLVENSAIEDAGVELLSTQHILAEPAGAAPLAAAHSAADRVRGKCIVFVVSGANVTVDQLRAILDRHSGD